MSVSGVCVIIPAFNAAGTIGRAIRSVIQQPQVDQILLVDDASNDQTPNAARLAAQGSNKLQIIELKQNGGPARARKIALQQCSLPYFAILDADDEFAANRFADIPSGDWDIVADNILFQPENADEDEVINPAGESGKLRTLFFAEFLESNIAHHSNAAPELGFLKPIIRKDTFDRLRLQYDERLRLGEDYMLYAQALARGASFMLKDRTGYIAHVRSDSLSRRHSTNDLTNLRLADQEFIEELRQSGASRAQIAQVNRHIALLTKKISIRNFLDQKKEIGLGLAGIKGMANPFQLFSILLEIARDRGRHQSAVSQTKRLFDGENLFAGAA